MKQRYFKLALFIVIAVVLVTASYLAADLGMHPVIIAALIVAGPLAAILLYAWHYGKPRVMSTAEVIEILRIAADGRMDTMDWDEFVARPIRDPKLNDIRKTCETELHYEYEMGAEEAESDTWFSNPVAQDRLRELIDTLEADRPQIPAA